MMWSKRICGVDIMLVRSCSRCYLALVLSSSSPLWSSLPTLELELELELALALALELTEVTAAVASAPPSLTKHSSTTTQRTSHPILANISCTSQRDMRCNVMQYHHLYFVTS
jgi:hypothetical protein